VTTPTVQAPAQAPDAARREAQIRALEAAAVAAAVVGLADRLDAIGARVRAAAGVAVTAPAAWLAVRRRAAADLRAVRPAVAARITRILPRAADLGAQHAGGPLPAGHDPTADGLIGGILDRVDGLVREKLTRAARALRDDPATTPAGIDALLARVDAARQVAETAAGDATTRAIAGGAAAAADELGISLEWVTEPGACAICLGYAGSIREPGGRFHSTGPPPLAGDTDIEGPPGPHPHCRCWLRPSTQAVTNRLRRRNAARVALGPAAQLSAGLRTLDQLLRSGRVRLPSRRQADTTRARGRFRRR